jgi:hypothetical protein
MTAKRFQVWLIKASHAKYSVNTAMRSLIAQSILNDTSVHVGSLDSKLTKILERNHLRATFAECPLYGMT